MLLFLPAEPCRAVAPTFFPFPARSLAFCGDEIFGLVGFFKTRRPNHPAF